MHAYIYLYGRADGIVKASRAASVAPRATIYRYCWILPVRRGFYGLGGFTVRHEPEDRRWVIANTGSTKFF